MRESTKRHYREVRALPEPQPEAAKSEKVQVIVLASGSKGNCMLITCGPHALMIDCGISLPEASKRCRSVGYVLSKLDAILLTHWHKDHVKYLSEYLEFSCPVVCSTATRVGMAIQPENYCKASPEKPIHAIEPFTIFPIKIDHEEGSLAFHVRVAGKNIVVAHDLGAQRPDLVAATQAADCLLLEFNYDGDLLSSCQDTNHSAELHARIASFDRGHLANVDAGQVVAYLNPDRIKAICALHLSHSHNTEELAEEAIRCSLPEGSDPDIYIARQDSTVLIDVDGKPAQIEPSLLDQYRKLDSKVNAVIEEQKRVDRETLERRIVIGDLQVKMQAIFDAKPTGEKLEGFQFFDDWKEAKAKLYGISKRTMDYYLNDAGTVVPLIGREAARELPLTTVAELAKYAKAKHEIPDAILQFAREHTTQEVKAKVASVLYPGKTGHFDGPEDFITITAGKAQVEFLRSLLTRARGYVDAKASDAEIIEHALHHFIEFEEDQIALRKAAGNTVTDTPVPPAPTFDIDDFLLEETDGERTTHPPGL